MRRTVRVLVCVAVTFLALSAVFVGLLQNAHLEPEEWGADNPLAATGLSRRLRPPRMSGVREEHPDTGGAGWNKGVADLAKAIQAPLPVTRKGSFREAYLPQGAMPMGMVGKAGASVSGTLRPLVAIPGGPPPYLQHPGYSRIWPERFETKDRIINQMNLVPRNHADGDTKLILIYNGLPSGIPPGDSKFRDDECPVKNCVLSEDRLRKDKAHVVLFQNGLHSYPDPRPEGQIWIMFVLESPLHIRSFDQIQNMVNWTATYRLDSTINTPYERFVPFANATKLPKPAKNYAASKKHLVAWFVSNCGASNGRLQYAQELANHISVHIYGSCGDLQCSRSEAKECYKKLSDDYKFYLAFENSNCIDYITEKFYWNALYNDVVPIAMGARPEDYQKVAPPHSFIHVDDFESPRHLAEFLHKLDADDSLYNEYFRWKGTGEFINTKFWCRLCSLAHEALDNAGSHSQPTMWYSNLQKWWNGPDVCISAPPKPRNGTLRWATWRNVNRTAAITDKDTLVYG